MIKFETINELTLKVTTTGNDVIFTKTGAFIAGDCSGNTNYRFEKVLLGPQKSLAQAALGSLMRRVTGENIPLTKVTMNGPSETYYAESAQHVLVYKLEPGETISVESENLLAFTQDCKYSVRFIGVGVLSQKGLATTTLTGNWKRSLCGGHHRRKPDRTQQCTVPQYDLCRSGRCDLLDGQWRLRPAHHNRCQLENLYRTGFWRILFL